MVDKPANPCYTPKCSERERPGGIAQLGERLNGIQEVSGSIPLISTNKKDILSDVLFVFMFPSPNAVTGHLLTTGAPFFGF